MQKEHHIGFVVPDLEVATKQFLNEGCEFVSGPTEEPSQGVKVAFVRPIGASVLLELVAPLGLDTPIKSRLARGGGLDHIGYQTYDLEADMNLEIQRGGKVLRPPTVAQNLQCRVAFVYRRSGLVVELIEQSPYDASLQFGH